MQFKKLITTLLLSTLTASLVQAEVRIGVITSASGPIALVGIPQKNSVALMPTQVGNQRITYISLDDRSDPASSVEAFKRLIEEERVDAIIGPSGSPNAMSLIQLAADSGTPMLAPVGSAAVVLPMTEQKKWVFKTTQNDDLIAQALVEHMSKNGVKTLGFIGTADPYGENWAKVLAELAEQNGIRIVASERFERQATAIISQGVKITMAQPDAVLIAAPGTSAVMPQIALYNQNYRGQIYQTHGAALAAFLQLGGQKVEGTILAASLMLVLDEVPDSHPSKAIAREYIDAYTLLNGRAPATFGANVYDAGLLLQQAIPIAQQTAEPGTAQFRAALRDALEQTRELAGTQGVYNMSAEDHSGFDERGRELITVKDRKWALLK